MLFLQATTDRLEMLVLFILFVLFLEIGPCYTAEDEPKLLGSNEIVIPLS